MKRKIILTTFIALAVFGNTSFAQEKGEKGIPKVVQETFSEQYSGATNIDYKDQVIRVDVHFELEGDKMIASYSNKGKWKETEKEWTYDKLPEEIKDGFQKSRYADREVEETKVIYLPGGATQYRLKAKKNGVQKKYLYFNTKGRLIRETITL